MKKTALLIMIVTLFTKVLGFSRDITLAYFYGATSTSDAFIISNYIPGILLLFVATGVSTTFIALYNEVLTKHGRIRADQFTNNIINFILIISTVFLLLGQLFTSELVKIFASGFVGSTLKLTITLTKISLFGMYATGALYVLNSYLQVKGHFITVASISIPLNLVTIVMIALSYKFNILFLGIGSVLSIVAQLIYLIPKLKTSGFKFSFFLNLKDEYMIKIMKLSIFSGIGATVNQINVLVDRTIASNIMEGGISVLNYSDKLIFYIQALFVVSLSTVMYPSIAKKAAANELNEMKIILNEVIIIVIFLLTPITIGAMIFANPVIELLFSRGAFDALAVSMTSSTLYFYSIGMIGIGLRDVLSKAFYAMQDTRTPMINATIGIIVNIILNLILSRYMGIRGLALATSISAILTMILLFNSLNRKIGSFGIKKILLVFLKILFASVIMGSISKICFNYLSPVLSHSLSLLLSVSVGGISYLTIVYFMKIEDFDLIIQLIKEKFKALLNKLSHRK